MADVEDSPEKVIQSAEAAKKRGNSHFQKQEYEKAIAEYSIAIGLRSEEGTYYQNRSIALRQLERWAEAEQDAAHASTLQPSSVKAIFGRALCLQKLRRFAEALQVTDAGLQLEAENKALLQLRNEVLQEQTKESKPKSRNLYPDKPAVSTSTAAAGYGRRSSSSSSSSSSSGRGAGAPTRMFAEYAHDLKARASREVTAEELPAQRLCESARDGNIEECRQLLEGGSVKNVSWPRPEDGNTPLHLAAEGEHSLIVKVLVTANADPEAVNYFGLKPVALAQKGGKAYRVLDKLTARLCEESRRNALQEGSGGFVRV